MSSSKRIVEALTAAFRSGPAQERDNEFYRQRPQSYFIHGSDKGWKFPSSRQNELAPLGASVDLKTIRVISWNIDMLVPFGNERMTAALQYLEDVVASTPAETAIVILLQEMTNSDLDCIKSSQWIQQRFAITDKDHSSWLTPHYGTTTLIDMRLDITDVFRIPVLSKFSRDGLFVDIAVSAQVAHAGETPAKVLRLCNVHLESLVADPPVRPCQLSAIATYLHAPEVACALLAGDLNAIQPFDRTLHTDNRLEDAYLSPGGKEDSDEGYTWGYQVSTKMREKFGCSRMDKILFRGAVRATAFERIGAGVKVAKSKHEEVRQAGEEEWVTDHYGVMGDFELSGDGFLRIGDGVEGSKLKPS